MIGDRLVIKDKHRRAAEEIANRLLPEIQRHSGIYSITLAGESGSGKSETGQALAEHLSRGGFETLVLQQDDYFVLPPKSNDRARRRDIGRVGMQEVRLDLLDEHLLQARSGAGSIRKPLVVYEEDRISEETVSLQATAVVVAEGTYTTVLKNANARVFIDLSYLETLQSRLERAREAQDDFLEKVLAIEHRIISAQKTRADLIIDKDYRLRPA
jgi:uridine kinase